MLYAVIETGAPCPVLYPESVSPSVVSDSVTPKTVAQKAPLFMGFSRPEYWSELPFPSPGDLPKPGIKPGSPVLQADSLPAEPRGKPLHLCINHFNKKMILCEGFQINPA